VSLNSTREDWSYSQSDGARLMVEIHAKKFGESADNQRVRLEGVELHLYHSDGQEYDLVRSAQAEFTPGDKRMFSDGEVNITLQLPAEGQPKRAPVTIRSSGVTYYTDTGKAVTDRPASFTFEHGDGTCVGASYDPATKELRMDSQALINWKSDGPNAKPMKIESGQLVYKEADATIWLMPWARLTRESTVVEGGPTTVTLEDGVIHQVDALAAHGVDSYPNRQLRYAADHVWVDFDDNGVARKIAGAPHASVVSVQEASETTITADRVDMLFNNAGNESVLTSALANGNAVVISKPLPPTTPAKTAPQLPETRIMRSQIIDMRMRPGGKELDNMETQAAGTLEFVPNQPGQHHRTLEGQHFWIQFGGQNRLESFRTIEAKTRTDPTGEELRRNRAPVVTRSRNLTAQVDTKTNQLSRMEQWDDFAYEEGDRKARASKATLDSNANQITLQTSARMWDSTGGTSADVIYLDQRTGNFTADGHVNSSRLPEKQKKTSDLLSGDEPMQGLAQRMTSAEHNRLLHYEGSVVLWQGADRLQAERVDIDRIRRLLAANGNVLSQFRDKPADDAANQTTATPPPAPVFTIVKAGDLVYTESNRLARYQGNVSLSRPGMQVKADDLKAYLAESGAESRLDKAYADGNVRIVQTSPDRTRTGVGHHAEYYTDDDRIVLKAGGQGTAEAQLTDSRRGNARGTELTYFSNDDRLLVNGSAGRQAVSRIQKH
jgi:lipopolysaccharide export system protein LptA